MLRRLAPLLRPAAWNHRWTTPRGKSEFLAERRQARP